jgi:hypothetical protein
MSNSEGSPQHPRLDHEPSRDRRPPRDSAQAQAALGARSAAAEAVEAMREPNDDDRPHIWELMEGNMFLTLAQAQPN